MAPGGSASIGELINHQTSLTVVRLYWPLGLGLGQNDRIHLSARILPVADARGLLTLTILIDGKVDPCSTDLTETSTGMQWVPWTASLADMARSASSLSAAGPWNGGGRQQGRSRMYSASARAESHIQAVPSTTPSTVLLFGRVHLAPGSCCEAPVRCTDGCGGQLPLRVLCYDPGAWRLSAHVPSEGPGGHAIESVLRPRRPVLAAQAPPTAPPVTSFEYQYLLHLFSSQTGALQNSFEFPSFNSDMCIQTSSLTRPTHPTGFHLPPDLQLSKCDDRSGTGIRTSQLCGDAGRPEVQPPPQAIHGSPRPFLLDLSSYATLHNMSSGFCLGCRS